MNWNNTLNLLPLSVAALAISACATVPAPASNGSNVALGQAAYVDGPNVKPLEILEDSRCPMNARCIWAGRVRLKMLWLRPSGDKEFEVTLGEPTQLADGKFTLTSVRPEVVTNRKIKPSEYRFSFEFAGGL